MQLIMKRLNSRSRLAYFAEADQWHNWNLLVEKSNHGKETTFFWKGQMPGDNVRLIPVESSIKNHISKERLATAAAQWKEIEEKNPKAFDAPKWRFEAAHYDPTEEKLLVCISPTSYSVHAGTRFDVKEDGTPYEMYQYAHPITLNTVQITLDDSMLVGVRGAGSDQRGLCLLGSGFIERRSRSSDGASRLPKTLAEAVQEECLTEGFYDGKRGFNVEDVEVLAIVSGSNHDATFATRVIVPYRDSQISANLTSDEHEGILFLPNNPSIVEGILKKGYYDFKRGNKTIRGEAADHMIGCLERHLEAPLPIPEDLAANYKPLKA
jgi:hypothetical protein